MREIDFLIVFAINCVWRHLFSFFKQSECSSWWLSLAYAHPSIRPSVYSSSVRRRSNVARAVAATAAVRCRHHWDKRSSTGSSKRRLRSKWRRRRRRRGRRRQLICRRFFRRPKKSRDDNNITSHLETVACRSYYHNYYHCLQRINILVAWEFLLAKHLRPMTSKWLHIDTDLKVHALFRP